MSSAKTQQCQAGAISFLRTLLAPHAQRLILAVGSAFLSVLGTLAVPILLGITLNILLNEQSYGINNLETALVLLLLAILVAITFQWIQGVISARITYRVTAKLRASIFEKIQKLSVSTLDAKKRGDLASLVVNDADLVGDGILQGAQQVFIGTSTIVGTMIIMLYLSLPIALLVIFLTPFSILITARIAKSSYKNFQLERKKQAEYAACIEEIYANESLLHIFNHEKQAENVAEHINQELYQAGEASQFAGSLTNPGTRFVNNIVYALVAFLGCISLLSPTSTLTIGIVQSFLAYASQFSKPFYEITGVLTQLQAALAALERIAAFLSLPEMKLLEPGKQKTLKNVQGSVTFQHVSFAYHKDQPILQDVSFAIEKGKHFALVGETGCGKTTLMNLLLGFISPDEGVISLDAIPTSSIVPDELRSHIGMVLQDTWIFSGTVFENIAFAKSHATREEVIRAAEQTQAALFINQLPHGYDTPIGGTTNLLSDGQKQLLAITRAVLKDAPVLVLDEATSSIDTRTELLVQAALEKLMRGRTTLTVAHRLSTIKKSDEIFVMDKGRIVERGTQEDLIKQSGLYAKLYRSQFSGAAI